MLFDNLCFFKTIYRHGQPAEWETYSSSPGHTGLMFPLLDRFYNIAYYVLWHCILREYRVYGFGKGDIQRMRYVDVREYFYVNNYQNDLKMQY